MFQLDKLVSTSKKRKRIGRGGDSGGTSGKGHKGQKARTGSSSEIKSWFEGGQMPLPRRIPKRGFTNQFKKYFEIINLKDLEKNFITDDQITRQALQEKGLISSGQHKKIIKILGKGELTKKFTVHADAFSKSAVEAIKKAGGSIELIKKD